MTTQDLVRSNFSSVRKSLDEVIAHLEDEMLYWAPRPEMHSIHRVLMDILTTEVSIVERLQGVPRRSDEELDAPYLPIKTVDGMAEMLELVRAGTLTYLSSLSESDLGAPAKISQAFQQELDLTPAPVSEVLRYIARHEYYHTAQLISYLWTRGDDPYEWE